MHTPHLLPYQPDSVDRSRRAAERFALETAVKERRALRRTANRAARTITITLPFAVPRPLGRRNPL